MDIKAWLNQYRKARRYAEKCFRDLDAAEISVKSPNMDGMPRGGVKGDNVERMAIHELELRDRAEKARDEAIKLADEIYDAIGSLKDYEQKTVIVLRYIYGFSWEEISTNINASVRTVYRVHGRALEELRRNYDKVRRSGP